MPRVMKPMALKELENRRDQLCKARKSGQAESADVQRRALSLLSGPDALRDWGEMRRSGEFFDRFVVEFSGMPFYYQVDFAMLGLACDSLERYHAFMDQWREASDTEEQIMLQGAISREARNFLSLGGKLGLDPASRDKFLLNNSLRNALDDKERFEW